MLSNKICRTAALICTVATLLFLGCGTESPTGVEKLTDVTLSKAGQQQSVTGHVETGSGGIFEKYSFAAVRHRDGTVTGEWQTRVEFPSGFQITAHGNVTCLVIDTDGKTATIGGIVESSTFRPEILVGSDATWIVVDNGEGANAPPDEATDLSFGSLVSACGDFTFAPLTPIARGNIQVRP